MSHSHLPSTIGAVMAAISAAFLTHDHGWIVGGAGGAVIGVLVAVISGAAMKASKR